MRIRQHHPLLALVAVSALTLTACGGSSDVEAGNNTAAAESCGGDFDKVGYAPYVNTGGYFPFVEKGLSEALGACGIEVATSDPDADSAKQVTGIENLVASGSDVILVTPVDVKAISPVASRLAAQDVAVIGLATDLPEADVIFNLDDVEFGRLEGESAGAWLTENAGENPKVAILHQDSGGDPLLNRHKGVIEGLDEALGAGNYELVSEVEAFQEDTGNSATSTILQAHPDLDMIVGMNDFSALGALSAVKAQGLTPGKDIGIVTGGEDERIVKAVLSGEVVSTIGLFPIAQGETIAKVILELASGNDVEREQIVPAELVTKENAESVLQGGE